MVYLVCNDSMPALGVAIDKVPTRILNNSDNLHASQPSSKFDDDAKNSRIAYRVQALIEERKREEEEEAEALRIVNEIKIQSPIGRSSSSSSIGGFQRSVSKSAPCRSLVDSFGCDNSQQDYSKVMAHELQRMKSQIMAEMKQTIESLENQMQMERKEKEKAQSEVKQMQVVSGNFCFEPFLCINNVSQ